MNDETQKKYKCCLTFEDMDDGTMCMELKMEPGITRKDLLETKSAAVMGAVIAQQLMQEKLSVGLMHTTVMKRNPDGTTSMTKTMNPNRPPAGTTPTIDIDITPPKEE